jgi:hypothetical protein
MDIGRAIRFCRQQKGLTQPQLAERAALSASYLSVLETGETPPVEPAEHCKWRTTSVCCCCGDLVTSKLDAGNA